MSILNWFRGLTSKRAVTYSQGLDTGLVTLPTFSGVSVNEQTALGVSAVWCAVKVISEQIGSLPLILYRAADQGAERAETHPLYRLFHDEPNPQMTRPVFWETFVSHCLLWGNGLAEIQRDGSGRPVALWLLHPQNVQPVANQDTGRLVYRVGGTVDLDPADVLHVPGLSPDGTYGYSLLKLARNSLGFSIAAEQWGQSYFGNNARPAGTINHPGKLSSEARENMRRSWQALYGGPQNAGKVALMEEGAQFSPFSISNEAGQYDETRKFQVSEVARLFNISTARLHGMAGTSQYGTLDTLYTDFYMTTLRPWIEKIETEIERKCFGEDEKAEYEVEFLVDAILRGDTAGRYNAYAIALQNGWLTINEVRAKENLSPLPDAPEVDPVEDEDIEEAADAPDDKEPNG